MHCPCAWMGRGWRPGVHPSGPPQTHIWSRTHFIWNDFLPCFLFHLPPTLSHAHGEPTDTREAGFACPHPQSASVPASTAQLQTGLAEILPWGSSGTKFACSVSLQPLGQPRSLRQSLPVLLREKSLLHKQQCKKCVKNRGGGRKNLQRRWEQGEPTPCSFGTNQGDILVTTNM